MARRCILHFGMHKTGSTSIQKTLFRLATPMPWVYLSVGTPNSSLALETMFSSKARVDKRNIRQALGAAELRQRRQDYFKRMEAQIASTKKDLLLSGEGMSVMGEAELKRLVDWVAPFVDEVVAVGYVRPPKAYMESAFQQVVKGGYSEFNLNAVYPNYRKRFEKFENLLGRDKVEYWLFEPKNFQEGCVVRDFFAHLGVGLKAKHVKRVNESLSRDALSILYSYRKFGEGFGTGAMAKKENLLLIKKLSEIEGKKLRFSPDLVRPILESRKSDIAWMEERLGQPFPEDWEAHTEFELSAEADLLECSESSLATLCKWTGRRSVEGISGPKDMAQLVAELRHTLSNSINKKMDTTVVGSSQERMADSLDLYDLLDRIKSAHPGQFDKINNKKLVSAIDAVLTEIKKQIENTEEGVVGISSLGNFHIKKAVREAAGAKNSIKKVIFR